MPSALARPTFTQRLDELGPASDRAWLAATTTALVTTLIAVYPCEGSVSGKFWCYAAILVRASVFAWSREGLRGRGGETLFGLFALGLVAGVYEILADFGLVHWVARGRLVYTTGNDVVVLASPIWMPFGWACVITELGYPCVRLFGILRRRLALRPAALATCATMGIQAGMMGAFWEVYAWRAGWWYYEPARVMLADHCAAYIALAEVFMGAALLPIAARAIEDEARPLAAAVGGGVRFGAVIMAAYAAAYLLLEAW